MKKDFKVPDSCLVSLTDSPEYDDYLVTLSDDEVFKLAELDQ